MNEENKFRMPSKSNLRGRTSTITNAFAISITPYIRPNSKLLDEYYKSLRIKPGICAYCLQNGNSSDHFHSLVKDKKPTGYITEISNLIPCCSACNSSKGSKEFNDWYLSDKNIKRLHKLGLTDEKIRERYSIINNHVKKYHKEPLNYEEILGKELWKEYENRRKKLLQSLKDNQDFCDNLAEIILKKLIASSYSFSIVFKTFSTLPISFIWKSLISLTLLLTS